MPSTLNDRLDALEASAARLASLLQTASPETLTSQAYPAKWTIADVASHLGSGATIMRRNVDTAVTGVAVEKDFNQSVWDEWNAKSPDAMAADALAADRALLDRLAPLSDAERASFEFSMGPFVLDLSGFVGLRLNEHVLHTWDVEVAIEPGATLPSAAAAQVIDNLEMLVGFAGKSDGRERIIAVRTTDPVRAFSVMVKSERVSLVPRDESAEADVELPSEAFVRLLYGRLDPAHTPVGAGSPLLDELRVLFPGL